MKKMTANQALFLIRMGLIDPTLLCNYMAKHKSNPEEDLVVHTRYLIRGLVAVGVFVFLLCVSALMRARTEKGATQPWEYCVLVMVGGIAGYNLRGAHISGRKFVKAVNELNELLVHIYACAPDLHDRDKPYYLHYPSCSMRPLIDKLMAETGARLWSSERFGVECFHAVQDRKDFKRCHRVFDAFELAKDQGEYLPALAADDKSATPAEIKSALL